MSFGMIILNENINKMQNYATWILIVLSLILKLEMFMKILLMMLKKDLIHQIMKLKIIGLIKDELGGKIITTLLQFDQKHILT